MQMFLDCADHAQFLADMVDRKPSLVLMSSFGLYAGITYDGRDTAEWGEKYRLATRDLMDAMRSLPDVRLLIGISNYSSCRGTLKCLDCEKRYCRTLLRLMNHAELFPQFRWRVSRNLHLKCALFFWDKEMRGVAGGRNLSDSDWIDCTFELDVTQIKKLQKHVCEAWNASHVLSDKLINSILEEEGISEDGLNAVLDA